MNEMHGGLRLQSVLHYCPHKSKYLNQIFRFLLIYYRDVLECLRVYGGFVITNGRHYGLSEFVITLVVCISRVISNYSCSVYIKSKCLILDSKIKKYRQVHRFSNIQIGVSKFLQSLEPLKDHVKKLRYLYFTYGTLLDI